MEHRTEPVSALRRLLLGCALLWLIAAPAPAQASERLVVATKEAAPFSFRGPDGSWRGISVELWKGIAEDLGLSYDFQEAPLVDLIAGLQDGRFDASVAALTVTSEREQFIDFTHSYHPSGLGIAVPNDASVGLLANLRKVFSVGFFQAVGTLMVVLFLGGFVLWLLERKHNKDQFGGSLSKGLGAAFWWSAVTMTTVGYGDKAPVTGAGRIVAVIWMFASVITISGLTATIASTLTVSQLEHSVGGPGDLPALGSIACVRGSTGERYLIDNRLPRLASDTAREALQSLADGRAKAAVYDAPILRYLVLNEFESKLSVLPVTFKRQDYAIALPLDSPLRKAINKSLLARVSSDAWNDVLYKYLGLSE